MVRQEAGGIQEPGFLFLQELALVGTNQQLVKTTLILSKGGAPVTFP